MDVFDLYAKIALDKSEYESGLNDAKGKMSTFAQNVGNGLKTVAKVGAAAVSAGVAGVAALTKMGIEGYKQYEQLAGGAELMWGDAYKFISQQASNAYKNVQMSQNDYLQQVNGFAVGLKTALGGNEQAAAELADRIITAEADIVAATGNTQENVQNAFNGIMKNNFSMVDNLGLGITATKEGFQTMIDSVNAYNAAHGKSTQYTIDNVADCQAALLDYIEMQGMSGYAAAEAAQTIEGSLAMMKGAWQNLVVGMADSEADMEGLISNFVESTAIAAQNLLPRIQQILVGIGDLITKLAPVIADALPALVEAVLPSLLTAAVSLVTALVNGIIKALPALYDALLIGVQTILVEVFGVSEKKAGEFADGVNLFFTKIRDGFGALVTSAQTEGTFLNEVWTGIKDTAQLLGDFLSALWSAVSTAFSWCVEQMNTEGTFLNQIMSMVWNTIQERVTLAIDMIQGCLSVFTAVLRGDWSGAWDAVLNITRTIFDSICHKVDGGLEFLKSICPEGLRSLLDSFSSIWNRIVDAVRNCIDNIQMDGDFLNSVWLWLQEAAQKLGDVLSVVWNGISTAFSWCVDQINTAGSFLRNVWSFLQEAAQIVGDALALIWKGVSTAFSWCVDNIDTAGAWLRSIWEGLKEIFLAVQSALGTAFEAVTNAFSVAVEQISVDGEWLEELWANLQKAFEKVKTFLVDAFNFVSSAFTMLVEGFVGDGEWLKTIWVNLQKAGQSMSDYFGKLWDVISSAFRWCVEEIVGDGEWLKELWVKIQDTAATVSEYISAYWEALTAAFSWCVDQINTEGTFLNKVFNGIKEYTSTVFANIKTTISVTIDVIKGIFATFTAILRGDWEGAFTAIRNTAESVWAGIIKCWGNVGTWFNNNVVKPINENVVKPISTALDNMKKKFTDIWDGCKKIVSDAVTALKNALKFDWSLPKLKLPHISVSGGEAPYGIAGKGKLPSFSIEWYKKAYDNAMVLSSPTIFGFDGNRLLGGGDGNGNEIVAGESHLMNLIGQVVEYKTAGQNQQIIALLSALLTATVDGNEEMVRAVMSDKHFAIGDREFARLVKTYA